MRKIPFLTFFLVLFLNFDNANAQTEWTGPTITVTKADSADWTLAANQDRITANVWLTRAHTRGLFNIVTETEFDNTNFTSPAGTRWANGTIADGVGTLNFTSWDSSNVQSAPTIGQNKVLYLVADNIYIDFVVTAWTSGMGNGGGGFTYQRSTDPVGINELESGEKINLFPNPTTDFIQVLGLTKKENYNVYDILGKKVLNGVISNVEKVEIQQLKKGVYFIEFDNGVSKKFIKK